MSCCFMCVVSCHVEGRLAISCRVMSRSVTSCRVHVVVPKRGVCASFLLPKDHVSHTATDSDQIANGTPATYLLILDVFQKKKRPLGFSSAGTGQIQRAQMNNAPEHDPRKRMFGSTTTRQPSGQFGSRCCLSKKHLCTWEGPTLRPITERRLKKNSRGVKSRGPSKECQDPQKEH